MKTINISTGIFILQLYYYLSQIPVYFTVKYYNSNIHFFNLVVIVVVVDIIIIIYSHIDI